MKRLISATLALTLLGATAASADSYGRGGYDRGYGHHHGDNSGALIGLGIGLFALGAIVASQHDNDRYDDRAYRNNYDGYGYRNEYRGDTSDYRGNYQDYRGNGYGYR
jgi:hypothetical protein